MTLSSKTTSREAIFRAIVNKLQDAGYVFHRRTNTSSEFFCSALNGLFSTSLSARTASEGEILARLFNQLNGTSVSPLTTPIGDILAGIANANIGGGGAGGPFFGLESGTGAFLLEGAGHILMEA